MPSSRYTHDERQALLERARTDRLANIELRRLLLSEGLEKALLERCNSNWRSFAIQYHGQPGEVETPATLECTWRGKPPVEASISSINVETQSPESLVDAIASVLIPREKRFLDSAPAERSHERAPSAPSPSPPPRSHRERPAPDRAPPDAAQREVLERNAQYTKLAKVQDQASKDLVERFFREGVTPANLRALGELPTHLGPNHPDLDRLFKFAYLSTDNTKQDRPQIDAYQEARQKWLRLQSESARTEPQKKGRGGRLLPARSSIWWPLLLAAGGLLVFWLFYEPVTPDQLNRSDQASQAREGSLAKGVRRRSQPDRGERN